MYAAGGGRSKASCLKAAERDCGSRRSYGACAFCWSDRTQDKGRGVATFNGRHHGCGPLPSQSGRTGSQTRRFTRASNPAQGLAIREDQGPGARRLLVASRCDKPGAGFQGRHTPLVMGSRGERSLLLVVVQRRSARSGWVSGGAGTLLLNG